MYFLQLLPLVSFLPSPFYTFPNSVSISCLSLTFFSLPSLCGMPCT